MRNSLRKAHFPLLLSTGCAAIAGCHVASVCEPPGSTSGVFVLAKNSDAYVAEMNKVQADVPHVACRAESTVETQVLLLSNAETSSTGNSDRGPRGMDSTTVRQTQRSDSTPYDPRVLTPRADIATTSGQYRILGVGRGLGADDCASAAMLACNEVIDAYYRKRNATRPLGIPCRVADERERCPASGGSPSRAMASASAPPPERNEPPLVSLVGKLDDDRTRQDAVRGIIQFFENAKKRADGNMGDANVSALVDRVIEPMAKTYTDAGARLDEKTRGALIRFLAEAGDARAGRAWTKALGSEDDVEWGALGIGANKYQEGASALGEAFGKLEAGSPKGSKASKNVRAAMLVLKDPTWKTLLLERVGRPLQKPDGSSEAARTAYQNEVFWQATSAEVLGELRDPTVTKSLLKIVMDPAKADVTSAALLGIVRVGKDAIPFLLDVLAGKDTELVALAKSRATDKGATPKAYVAAAAQALGEIGRADAREALVLASKSAEGDVNRASIALALTKLPPSPDAKKAFQSAYEKIAPGATTASPTSAARPLLLEAAIGFYDPAVVPWLLRQVTAAKGPDAEETRAAGLRSAIALMIGAQAPAVRLVVDKLGTDASKQLFRASAELVESCDVAVDCYAVKLADGQTAAVGAKAASMLGVFGDAKAAPGIVERLPRVATAEGRRGALAAIDHLVRDGGHAIADSLEARANDAALSEEDTGLRRVVLRLRAR